MSKIKGLFLFFVGHPNAKGLVPKNGAIAPWGGNAFEALVYTHAIHLFFDANSK